jgi:hypothetical protein
MLKRELSCFFDLIRSWQIKTKMGIFEPWTVGLGEAFLAEGNSDNRRIAAKPGNQSARAGFDNIKAQKIAVKSNGLFNVLKSCMTVR